MKTVAFSCKPMQQFHGQMNLLKNEIERMPRSFNISLSQMATSGAESPIDSEDYDMQSALSENRQQPGIIVIDGDLSAGFELRFNGWR